MGFVFFIYVKTRQCAVLVTVKDAVVFAPEKKYAMLWRMK